MVYGNWMRCLWFAICFAFFEHFLHPNSSTWLYYQARIDLNGDAMGNILKQLMRTWPRVNGWGPVVVWDWWGLYPYSAYSRNQMRSQGATESFLEAYSCRWWWGLGEFMEIMIMIPNSRFQVGKFSWFGHQDGCGSIHLRSILRPTQPVVFFCGAGNISNPTWSWIPSFAQSLFALENPI